MERHARVSVFRVWSGWGGVEMQKEEQGQCGDKARHLVETFHGRRHTGERKALAYHVDRRGCVAARFRAALQEAPRSSAVAATGAIRWRGPRGDGGDDSAVQRVG